VGGIEIRNLEMITYIEAPIRHDHAAHQRRHGRFGVERVGTMNNKPCVDSVLAYLFGSSVARRRWESSIPSAR
jgi:hypothetical protein